MEKVVFVAFARDDAPPLDGGDIRTFIAGSLGTLDPGRYPGLALQVEDVAANQRWRGNRPLPNGRPMATVSVWTECADDVADVADAVATLSSHHAGYVVTEAVPRWWTNRATSDDEPRAGFVVTSMLCRAVGMTPDQFLRHWRDVHMPMSLRIHPQWTYVRNVVARPLTPNAPEVDAICEEGFEQLDDILDPQRFYGADHHPTRVEANRAAIGDDVPKFLDTRRTQTSIMRDYTLRDLRAGWSTSMA
jgi:hypothetical protein